MNDEQTPNQPEKVKEDQVAEDTNSEQEVVSQNAEVIEMAAIPKQKFRHTKLIVLLVLTAILVGGASAGATYYLVNKDKDEPVASEADTYTDSQLPSINLDAKSVTEQAGTLASGYTWLDVPKQVEKLPLFKNPEQTTDDYENQIVNSAEYYLMGSGSDSSEVYVVAGPDEMGGRPYLVVIKNGESYSLVKNNSNSFFYNTTEGGPKEYHGPDLLAGVTVDPSSSIADMTAPDEIVFKGQKFTTKYPGSTEPAWLSFMEKLPAATEYSTYQEAGRIAEGIIYENISKDDPAYRVSRFELRIKPSFYMTLYLKGELSDQEIDPITWNDGSQNTVNYMSAGRGCGGNNSNEIAKYGKDQLVQIGKSTKGQIIYGFKENTNPLLAKHHAEYLDDSKNIESWFGDDETLHKKANFGLAINEYVALRPLYIVEDGIGRMLVFSRQDLVLVGGCAKPVVYAYPTVPTLIDVSVGADVTVSEPLYENGWSNVLAMPNGLLGYNGRQYDSLFWEGYGHGQYPEVTKGHVVSRSDAESTMRQDLARQGLIEKESSDFMEFWTSKIPNSPYVRISWLGTNDMEQLAPLYVSPAPDTRIRIFLDMEGLSEYKDIPAQNLYATPRTGFTVVEWGGLVTDGSVPLLR